MTSAGEAETLARAAAIAPNDASPCGRRQALWHLTALLIYLLALATPFHEVWREDLSVVVPMFTRAEPSSGNNSSFWIRIGEADQHFVAWQVSRNARVLLSEPGRLFDTEQCHPTPRSMAQGEPMIALGVLGMPFWLATGDPLLTYNGVLAFAILLAALAMYWLIREWTGSAPAGIAAGLLYAFFPHKLADINHYFIHDTTWTVLALLFAHRLFAHRHMARGRWRDALALAFCCAMQMAGSFYPFVSAALLALPFLAWLVARYGLRGLPPAPTVTAVVLVAAAGYGIFAPYVTVAADGVLGTRTTQDFATWAMLLPGGNRFPGWTAIALALCAFVPARGRARGADLGDPRMALLAGAALVGAVAISASSRYDAPLLYQALSALLPGFDNIRRPNEILSGLHICLCILSGLGCAMLLDRVPARHAAVVTGAFLALVFALTIRPAWLALEPPVVYRALPARPADKELHFYDALARAGNAGPVLELPRHGSLQEAKRVLLIGYHGRRSSACLNALSPVGREVRAIANRVSEPSVLARLRDMGFTTLVVHHPPHLGERAAGAFARQIREAAARPGAPLRRIHGIDSMTAYAIESPPRPGAEPRDR
ncbi:MAG: hypothetical protein JRG96_14200 [Deltaproteobacteria bacterium]|nr:hypothetical protein [Deltaproteobacteria bacterium]MBW2418644.1 hypothetical protein [Deltaproteobacteria bacterium]